MGYTKYEIARIIGARALQIAQGAPFMLELGKEDLEKLRYNPIEIAKLEFEKGIIPIKIRARDSNPKGADAKSSEKDRE